jgi:hypothetical protein
MVVTSSCRPCLFERDIGVHAQDVIPRDDKKKPSTKWVIKNIIL